MSGKVDQGVRLGKGCRERLLAEARYTRFEDRTIDRAMERRGREVEYSVEQLVAEHLGGVSIGSRARRPGFDGSRRRLGGARTRVGECGDRHSVRPRFDPRQVMALNDVAAADDPDAKHVSEHNGAPVRARPILLRRLVRSDDGLRGLVRRTLIVLVFLAVFLVGACAPAASSTNAPAATSSPAASDAGTPLADRLEAEIAVEGSPDWPLAAFDSMWVLAPDLPLVDDSATPNLIRIDPATNEVAATIPLPDRLCQGFTASERRDLGVLRRCARPHRSSHERHHGHGPDQGRPGVLPARGRRWVPVVPRAAVTLPRTP